MSRENVITLSILLVLALIIVGWKAMHGTTTGLGYYEATPDGKRISLDATTANSRLKEIDAAPISDAQKTALKQRIHFSLPRTLGIWVAAFFTLATLSFLYKDNPFYKIAEHAFVGISAGYWMVVGFWTTVVPNLIGKLFPRWTKMHLLPGLNLDEINETLAAKSWLQSGETALGFLPIGFIDYSAAGGDGLTASVLQLMNVWYWVPMILGVMLLWRLAPKGGWIARWPLGFILGTTAGLRLIAHLESDFLKQIQNTILPLIVFDYDDDGAFNFGRTFYHSMNNILIVVGVLCGMVYFFFSLEHKGIVGKASRFGVWVLMITFGAGFGYTVMGRVALLLGRFEFLVFDWLNLVPRG
ncbi:MAG: hypothetical protein D6744_14490 [Planctomycetota bacterium]|nr:MAG: hypothetical protein D6744_14490 [Planctomycetota bacterium]